MLLDDIRNNHALHFIEGTVRYLTVEEGGRTKPIFSGYRGQFHYADDPVLVFDGFQYFPDYRDDDSVPLGATVRTHIGFLKERWNDYHSKRMSVGSAFQIQEGTKVVGRGTVTGLVANPPAFDSGRS